MKSTYDSRILRINDVLMIAVCSFMLGELAQQTSLTTYQQISLWAYIVMIPVCMFNLIRYIRKQSSSS